MPVRVVTEEVRYIHELSLTLEHCMSISSPAAPGLTWGLVRPRAAGLLIGIEYSKVRDSSWMYLTSLVNYPNRRRSSCSTKETTHLVVVGL